MAKNLNILALKSEWPWLIAVFLFSFPSLLFVLLRVMFVPHKLPEVIDLIIVWTIALTGIFGAVSTLVAFMVAVVASFQSNLALKTKMVLWALVAMSVLSCWYASGVSP